MKNNCKAFPIGKVFSRHCTDHAEETAHQTGQQQQHLQLVGSYLKMMKG